MNGEKKRSLKQDLERSLKRIKVLSSSSSQPGPSAQSTRHVYNPVMSGIGLQAMPEYLEPSSFPLAAPPPNVEPYGNTWNPLPVPSLHAPPTAEQNVKRERWTELKAFANIFSKGLSSFGPLKQAVDGIVAGIETFEIAAHNRADYEHLRSDLNGLFHDLTEFFEASTPPVMAPSIANLAQGIDRELESVRLKLSKTRLGTHLIDVDEVLEHYRRIEALLQRISINVNLKTWRTVNEQATENWLKSLPNSSAAKYNSAESSSLRGGCTKDTRLGVLEELYRWACDCEGPKIYWLNGMAGTGKTTIAYSLCERLETSENLAASFFCSRQLPTCRNANWIIPTISYQLSRFSYPFQSVISQVLGKDPDAHNRPMLDQFKKLISGTLVQVKDALPANLVVVIDALDECDDNTNVDRMLDALLSHAKELPVKFFVASRPDAKILDRMRSQHGKDLSAELRLHELGRSIVQEDIRRYLTARLSRPRLTLSASDLDTLVERSGVLFVYASTVVRYVGHDNFSRAGSRLQQILKLTKDSSSDSERDINMLYSAILAAAFDDSNLTTQDLEEMKLVLDTAVCAQEPLSTDVMAGLLGLDADSVWAALRPLFSVLHVLDETQIVTTLHESFPDYLLNRNRSGVFHCDAKKHNTRLAQLCFEQMKLPDPPFNICNLESSYVSDEDVPDLPTRVEKAISEQLLYACRYWIDHCMSAEVSQDLVSMLREFASERFLLWMEVTDLCGNIEEGVSALRRAHKWSLKRVELDDGIKEFLRDMSEFADSFASTADGFTPHIYVSTLTFWPDHSPISDHYGQQRTRLTTERSTALSLRKSARARYSEDCRFRALYSPDGAYVVSGGFDETIQIWNALTGQLVGQLLKGDADSVSAFTYSPDGAYIVSGCGSTLRIWDVHSGQPVGKALEGHTDYVNSVAYSPDGAYILSSSKDRTIRIWDAHTCEPVGRPMKGHSDYVTSAVYSPDGAYVVSGSWDSTIRIWDTYTGQSVGQPMEGHTGPVQSVAYSPDGAYIVSGADDCTIRIWDAYTHQPVGQLMNRDILVTSVAYSPDGAYIVSGYDDGTICIWNTCTGQPAGQPCLEGHTHAVNSVAYSPDGAYIVSGSGDRTVRIWSMKLALLMDDISDIDNRQPQLVNTLPAISEPGILCNLGCQINCPHVAWTLDEDGWIVFNDDKLICVPHDLQNILLFPQNTALMSTQGFLQLDLDRNKLGEHWHKYFQPRRLSNYD